MTKEQIYLEIYVPIQFKNEIDWICSWLFGRVFNLEYFIKTHDLNIISISKDDKRLDLPCIFFERISKKWLSPEAVPQPIVNYWEYEWLDLKAKTGDFKLPILFGEGNFNETSKNNWELGVDIFGSCFFWLSRYEEAVIEELDKHNRFSAHSSHSFNNGYLEQPIADYYAELLFAAMRRIWSGIYFETDDYSFKISHDVDSPGLYSFRSPGQILRSGFADIFIRRDFRAAFLSPYVKLSSKRKISNLDPYNTFTWIMDCVESADSTSIFYFLADSFDPDYDGDYRIYDPKILQLMNEISRRGHQIGLHPSYTSGDHFNRMKGELQKLRKAISKIGIKNPSIGSRMHYLKWSVHKTWTMLDKLNIEHDSSLGYADHIGFRAGTCHAYKAYSVTDRKVLDMEIQPLVVMEATLIDECYMGLGTDSSAFEKASEVRSSCRRVGGEFTLLWHNSRLVLEDERNLFRKLVETM